MSVFTNLENQTQDEKLQKLRVADDILTEIKHNMRKVNMTQNTSKILERIDKSVKVLQY
jgi:hypothetical protein